MLHEFSRSELLIGKEGLDKLSRSTVAIFGIGGVGSFTAEALARSGVGRLYLIDGDCVCLTNLNRQIPATHSAIGRPKVEVMQERILDINPRAQVIAHQHFYLPGDGDTLILEAYDYIVDAVDTVAAKLDLAVQAHKRVIPIMSSMGAGNKLDPTRFEVADIYTTSVCPLAKVMRHELRKLGIPALKVVYSREIPLTPRDSEEKACPPDCSCPGARAHLVGRRSIPGSMAFVAPAAGLIIAAEVVKDLLQKNESFPIQIDPGTPGQA